jgi:acyl-CoA synthetase (NDP forming)
MGMDFECIFNPRSLAVIGASSVFGKWGQMIFSNVVAGGFRGKIFPVNPNEKKILGTPAYRRVQDIPGRVDLAIITTPADKVPLVLEGCAEKGVKGVVVVSSGFSETDATGKELEKRIVSLCLEKNLLLVGPNTMGIICTSSYLFATGAPIRPRKGPVAFVSQSGNIGVQLIHQAEQQGLGISLFVGSGNEGMTSCVDFLEYLEKNPHTRIIILYLETIRNARSFMELAKRINKTKPVVVLKGGRTEAGRAASASHTGAMGGEITFFNAACRQAGLLNVAVPSELLDLSAAFSSLPLPKGNRVGIVTLGGGWGVVTADACNERGLVVPSLPDKIVRTIGKYLPPFWSRGNPVDLVGTRNLDVPLVALEEMLKWDGIDSVVTLGVVGRLELIKLLAQSTQEADASMPPEALSGIESLGQEYEKEYVARLAELMEIYEKPVLAVSIVKTGEGMVRPVRGRKYAPVVYQNPEDAVNVVARMVSYKGFLDSRGA